MNENIQIFDNLTGETIVRLMTDEEQKERDEQIAQAILVKEAKTQAINEAIQKKEIAKSKLISLGLSEDDLRALDL